MPQSTFSGLRVLRSRCHSTAVFFRTHRDRAHYRPPAVSNFTRSALLYHIALFCVGNRAFILIIHGIELADLGGAVGRISVTTIQRGGFQPKRPSAAPTPARCSQPTLTSRPLSKPARGCRLPKFLMRLRTRFLLCGELCIEIIVHLLRLLGRVPDIETETLLHAGCELRATITKLAEEVELLVQFTKEIQWLSLKIREIPSILARARYDSLTQKTKMCVSAISNNILSTDARLKNMNPIIIS